MDYLGIIGVASGFISNLFEAFGALQASDDARSDVRRAKNEAERVFRQACSWTYGLNGRIVDEERGFQLLTNAATLGCNEAKAELATFYFRGNNVVTQDYAEAVDLAEEAADANSPTGQSMLGLGRLE